MNTDIKNYYDTNIDKVYKNKYEFNRWFKNSRLRLDYSMMYEKISYVLSKYTFQNYFELGPGPGTWTRIAFGLNPEAEFTLVDISKEMKRQFELEMRSGNANVSYQVYDFLEFDTQQKYDLFFSSRAIEYIDNTGEVIKKIKTLLKEGGIGVVVTKNPSYFKLGAENRSQHKNQISVEKMNNLLKENGFKDIDFTPSIIRVALVDRITTYFSQLLFKKSFKPHQKVNSFCESYIVTFTK